MTNKNFAPTHFNDFDDDSAKSPDINVKAFYARRTANVKVTKYSDTEFVVKLMIDGSAIKKGKVEVDSAKKAVEAALYMEQNVQTILDK